MVVAKDFKSGYQYHEFDSEGGLRVFGTHWCWAVTHMDGIETPAAQTNRATDQTTRTDYYPSLPYHTNSQSDTHQECHEYRFAQNYIELKVEKETTENGSLSVCLTFGRPVGKRLCSPYSSATASSAWHQTEDSVSLGFVYFYDYDHMRHIFDQVPRGTASLGERTPWGYADGIIIYLSISLSGLEDPRVHYVITDEIMERWEGILLEEPMFHLQVYEYRHETQRLMTGGVELRVGGEVVEFHPSLDQPPVTSRKVFDDFVHFRNIAAIKNALFKTKMELQSESESESEMNQPLPIWFIEQAQKEETRVDLESPPEWIFPWLQIEEFAIKAIESGTLDLCRKTVKSRMTDLLRQKKTTTDTAARHKAKSAAKKSGSSSHWL
ncbi:hypothetical protein C8R42DRAFT_638182 [Lentinula raphanica]|nr:hypothetical protein C8R42DRAFT_638182 [Lentinula raphanica]